MPVNFFDPNTPQYQAPTMDYSNQGQGMAAPQMPGQKPGFQLSPDMLKKLAEMLKGGMGGGMGELPNATMAGASSGMGGMMGGGMPSMPGGFGGGIPMGGG